MSSTPTQKWGPDSLGGMKLPTWEHWAMVVIADLVIVTGALIVGRLTHRPLLWLAIGTSFVAAIAGLMKYWEEKARRVNELAFERWHTAFSEELNNRQTELETHFGKDLDRLAVAKVIARICREECKWPNECFLPTDEFSRMTITMYADYAVVLALRQELGVELVDEETPRLLNMTFGQIVDLVAQRLKAIDAQK